MVPENGSRVRLIDGLQAPRPLDLCHTRTALSVARGCLFFIGYGEAWPHNRLIGVRRLGQSTREPQIKLATVPVIALARSETTPPRRRRPRWLARRAHRPVRDVRR